MGVNDSLALLLLGVERGGEVVHISLRELYRDRALKDEWTFASSVTVGRGQREQGAACI